MAKLSCTSAAIASNPSDVNDNFPDSTPQPGQRRFLDPVPRFKSGIPKANPENEEDEWVFPSQQRMFNALRKKKWMVSEETIPAFLHIHNNINVATWSKVMAYERLHMHQCPNPKLKRFRGTPGEVTIKSWLKTATGYTAPFDTHHWWVDRCGEEVEYIIDFYDGDANSVVATTNPNDKGGRIDKERAPVTAFLDVRPAPTLGGIIDTLRVYTGI